MKLDKAKRPLVEWWVEFTLGSHFILQEVNGKAILVAMGGEYVNVANETRVVARRGGYM